MSDMKLPFDLTKFPDLTKILEQYKLPGVDIQGMIEARRADFDALRQANAIAFAGAQRIAERQAEILRTTLTEMTEMLKDLPNQVSNPSGLATKQSELVQTALTRVISNVRELAEAYQQSQSEVVEIINKRAQENLADLRKLLKIG